MSNRIECQEVAELALEEFAGRLDADRRAKLERHIEACPACRQLAAGQRAVWEALDAWNAAPVSAGFDARLYRRIEQDVSWWQRILRPLRPAALRQILPLTTAAGLAVAVAIVIGRPAAIGPAPRAAAVQVEPLEPKQAEDALQDMELLRDLNRLARPDSAESQM